MGLFDVPSPVDWINAAKNGVIERETANAFISSSYSALINGLWSFGAKNWMGLGQAARDIATTMYVNLSTQETKGFLVLTVNKEILDSANLARFQTEFKTK